MKNQHQRSRYATQESQLPKEGGFSLIKVKRRAGILNLFIKKKVLINIFYFLLLIDLMSLTDLFQLKGKGDSPKLNGNNNFPQYELN